MAGFSVLVLPALKRISCPEDGFKTFMLQLSAICAMGVEAKASSVTAATVDSSPAGQSPYLCIMYWQAAALRYRIQCCVDGVGNQPRV